MRERESESGTYPLKAFASSATNNASFAASDTTNAKSAEVMEMFAQIVQRPSEMRCIQ